MTSFMSHFFIVINLLDFMGNDIFGNLQKQATGAQVP